MVNFSAWIHNCNSHSLAALYLFLCFSVSVGSTMSFSLLGNSDHVVVSLSIEFPSNSQRDTLFYYIAYDYFLADWGSLCDHLRDVSWGDICKSVLLPLLGNFVSGSRLELTYLHSFTRLHSFQVLVLLPYGSQKSLFSFVSTE